MTTTELLLEAADPCQPRTAGYRVTLAADATDVLAAQQLRYDVFSTECGASTAGPAGVDADRFDDICDHLIVRHVRADDRDRGRVVATYRLLPPHANDMHPRGHGGCDSLKWPRPARYLAPSKFWCRPVNEFDTGSITRPARPTIPPLLRGYLRLGAVVCGPPALDSGFGTADFLILLDLEAADPRYLRFFLGAGSPAAQTLRRT